MNTTKRKWYRLDNAAKIIPSTTHFANTRVFRICCELNEEVDAALLQEALDATVRSFPYFNSILRKGLFWYYLEESDRRVLVRRDDLPACHTLYQPGRKELLYRVNYFGKRLNMEMYHVLADGTGAFVFFRRLVTNYLIRRHPEAAGADDRELLNMTEEENVKDAFNHYYTKGRGLSQLKSMSFHWAFRLKGPRDANMENHLVEGVISTKAFIDLAHRYQTTVGILAVALYIEAVIDGMTMRERNRKEIVISVPVNLRQFFPSDTNRNFFGVIMIRFCPRDGNDLPRIIGSVKESFSSQLSEEKIRKTMSSYAALEHNVAVKIVPLILKDLGVQGLSTISQMGVTCSVSNMGRIEMPEVLSPYISYFSAFTTAPTAQITIATYGDRMTFGWASGIATHQVMRAFYRKLYERGIEAVISTNDYDAQSA